MIVKYIICDECGGFYELEKEESLNDFESCLCGGSLSYAELTPGGVKKTTKNVEENYQDNIRHSENISEKNISEKSENICPLCGQINKINTIFCSKCGKVLKTRGSKTLHDYSHVLEGRDKRRRGLRGLYGCIDLWGVGCGIIF